MTQSDCLVGRKRSSWLITGCCIWGSIYALSNIVPHISSYGWVCSFYLSWTKRLMTSLSFNFQIFIRERILFHRIMIHCSSDAFGLLFFLCRRLFCISFCWLCLLLVPLWRERRMLNLLFYVLICLSWCRILLLTSFCLNLFSVFFFVLFIYELEIESISTLSSACEHRAFDNRPFVQLDWITTWLDRYIDSIIGYDTFLSIILFYSVCYFLFFYLLCSFTCCSN